MTSRETRQRVIDIVYNGILLNSVTDPYAITVRVLEGDANLTPETIINCLLEEKRKLGAKILETLRWCY